MRINVALTFYSILTCSFGDMTIKLTPSYSSTREASTDSRYMYTRRQLLDIGGSETFYIRYVSFFHCDVSSYGLCTKTRKPRKPTRRGTKGVKRKLKRIKPKQTGVNKSNLITIQTEKKLPIPDLPSIFMTNCRSLNQHKCNEIELVMNDLSPDVFTLTETWLTADKESMINFNGYNTYTANRPNKIGGGCCILVKSTLLTRQLRN
jgi:hypothetical protein